MKNINLFIRLRPSLAAIFLLIAVISAEAETVWRLGLGPNVLAGGYMSMNRPVGIGGQLAYKFMDLYSLEMSVNSYQAVTQSPENLDMNIVASVLTARVHFTPEKRLPGLYGGVGAGVYIVNSDYPDTGGKNRLRPSLCLGLEHPLAEWLFIYLDYRYVFQNYQFNDGFDHGLLRLGVNYGF